MVWPLGSRMLSGDDISKIQSPKRHPDLPNERNFHVSKTLSSVRFNQLIRLKNQNADFFESIWLLEKKRPAAKRLYTKRHTSLKLLNILKTRTKRKRRKPRTTSSFSKLIPHELSSTSSCGAKNKGITPKMIKHISSLCASTIPLGGGEFWITFWPTNHQLETLSYPFHSYINSSHPKAYLQKVSWTSIQSHPSRKIDQPPARIRMKASMQYKARKIRSTPPISQKRWLDGSKNRVEKNHRLFAVN